MKEKRRKVLVVCLKLVSLPTEKTIRGMKENKHLHRVHTGTDPNVHDFGMPHTINELKAELEDADREMDDPDKWCTSEQVWAEIRQAFPWANIR